MIIGKANATSRKEMVHMRWSASGKYHITGTQRFAAQRSAAALETARGDGGGRPRCVVSHSACIVEMASFGDPRMIGTDQQLRNAAMFH